MAKAKRKIRKRVLDTKSLGKNWGKAVQAMAVQQGALMARVLSKAARNKAGDTIEVHVPVLLHLSFARGSGAKTPPTVQCACVFSQDPNGSSVCVCKGPDAASCDCGEAIV
jgi:hypothetical protein